MTQAVMDGRNDLKLNIKSSDGTDCFGILMIEGGTSSEFPCFYLTDGSTTFYFWPTATTGVLRYGTTEPTGSTRGSAGATV